MFRHIVVRCAAFRVNRCALAGRGRETGYGAVGEKRNRDRRRYPISAGPEWGGGAAMEYRRRDGKDTWHWCPGCSLWPEEGYVARPGKPYYGELCGECHAREKSAEGVADAAAP